jgi:hypothetical protein
MALEHKATARCRRGGIKEKERKKGREIERRKI